MMANDNTNDFEIDFYYRLLDQKLLLSLVLGNNSDNNPIIRH